MIIALFIFLAASIIFSILVVAACMLSSDISQEEGIIEDHGHATEETGPATAQY